ncbi:hypothetical protein GGI07_000996 [Coemansia sp. Benny D115]|nr:hypothetical protein GGI07_000996 [Coemansia sp. Benny D115]
MFPVHLDTPVNNAVSNSTSGNGGDPSLVANTAVVQETAIQVAASFMQRQEVVMRLTRYRNFYEEEIARQQERMSDIAKAMRNFVQAPEISDSRKRAMEVLALSLEDAQKCLSEAQLAKSRLELEISQWAVVSTGDKK